MTKCTMPTASFPRCKGRQIVADIIEGGYYYVDKTPLIHRLVLAQANQIPQNILMLLE